MDYDNWLQKSAGCFDDDVFYADEHLDDIYEYWSEHVQSPKDLLTGYIPGFESFLTFAEEDDDFLNDFDDGNVKDVEEWITKDPNGHVTKLWDMIKPKDGESLETFLNKGNEWDDMAVEYEEYLHDSYEDAKADYYS